MVPIAPAPLAFQVPLPQIMSPKTGAKHEEHASHEHVTRSWILSNIPTEMGLLIIPRGVRGHRN